MRIVKDGRNVWPEPATKRAARDEPLGVARRAGLKFDANDEYTRVSYDYRGSGAGMFLNEYTRPRYHRPHYNRGGILVRESLRAENSGDDSFGQFTYRNYRRAQRLDAADGVD